MIEHSQRNKAFAAGALISLLSTYLTYGVATPLARFAWHIQAPWSALTWITSHFVHLNSVHLFVNLAALLVLLWIAQRLAVVGGFIGALLIAALVVCCGLTLQWWPVAWYCGLSGALHGGFAWLALTIVFRSAAHASQRARAAALALWTGGVFKVLLETLTMNNQSGVLGFLIVPQAHLFGYVGGGLWASMSVPIFRHLSRHMSSKPGQHGNTQQADK